MSEVPTEASGSPPAGPGRGARAFNLFRIHLKAQDGRTAGWLLALLAAGVLLLTVHGGAAAPGGPTAGSGARGLAPAALSATDHASGSSAAPASSSASGSPAGGADPLLAEEDAMDHRLAAMLSQVAGVGAVSVEVDLATGPTTVYATDNQVSDATSVQPTGSGDQTNTQHTADGQVVLGGSGQPAVQAVRAPEVAGVLVVAAGGGNPVLAEEITQAVEAATGVPAYRIVVLPAAGGN
jgi:stage III sporulation protein AG